MPKVIQSFVLKSKITGQTISPYGSLPHGDYTDWEKVLRGYTIQWDDGTVGCGRVPWKTREEAQAFLDANPKFGGMGRFTS